MEMTEVHFLHGFLGGPQDWLSTATSLAEIVDCKVITHDLAQDFIAMGENKSLEDWAFWKAQQIGPAQGPRVVVGYSLGGRLASHLEAQLFDAFLLIGAHPGLKEGRSARQESDLLWIERAEEWSTEEWLKKWNSQEVFQNDRRRPQRNLTDDEFSVQLQMLEHWSLAKQLPRDPWIAQNRERIFWCRGTQDTKFAAVEERMGELLPENHLFQIEDAGHGVLFDQPRGLAETLKKVMTHA